jgi:hypothetical protein
MVDASLRMSIVNLFKKLRDVLGVSLFYIYFCYLGIVSDHIQAAMPKQGLQRENISTGTKVGDRESVSKFMREHFHQVSPVAYRSNQNSKAILGKWSVYLATNERGVGFFSIFSISKITPQRPSSDFPQINVSPFSTFCSALQPMSYLNFSGFHIKVANFQRTQF